LRSGRKAVGDRAFATASTVLITLIATSRLGFAMARDGTCRRWRLYCQAARRLVRHCRLAKHRRVAADRTVSILAICRRSRPARLSR
jgi:hypothetical protein